MTLLTTIDNRIELLPYFINYHAKLGITHFIIGLWNGNRNPIYDAAVAQISKCLPGDVTAELRESLFCDYSQYSGPKETPWLNRMRVTEIKEGEWYAITDLDEFIAFPNGATFQQMLDEALSRNCHVVGAQTESYMDRIAEEGFPAIPTWGEGASLNDVFPLACDITKYCGCRTSRIVMAKQDVEILSDHHWANGHPILMNSAVIHHFKWNANVVPLLLRRYLSYSNQGLSHAWESAKFIEIITSNPDWRELPGMNTRPAPLLGI